MQQVAMNKGSAARLATQSSQSHLALGSVAAGRSSKPFVGTTSHKRNHHVVRAGAQGGYRRSTYMDRQPDQASMDSFEFEEMETYGGVPYTPAPYSTGLGGYPNQTYAPTYGSARNYSTPRQPLANRQNYTDYGDFMDMDEDEGGYDDYDSSEFGGSEPPPQQRLVNGKQLVINREIKADSVRVLAGADGRQSRDVMRTADALSLARELGVDLVLLNADATPPLCRLVKWSKYKYEVEKDQKKKASKAAVVETKEVRLRPGTDSNDLNTKMKSAVKFLEKGNKLKLVMKFEGRELQFKEQGKQVMLKFVEDLGAVGKVDGPINFKTGTYTAMLSPVPKTQGAGAPVKDTPEQAAPAPPQAAANNLPLPPATPPADLPPPPAGLAPAPAPLAARPAASPAPSNSPPPPPPGLAARPLAPAPAPAQRPGGPSMSPPPPPPPGGLVRPSPAPAMVRPGNAPPPLPGGKPLLSRPAAPPAPAPLRPVPASVNSK